MLLYKNKTQKFQTGGSLTGPEEYVEPYPIDSQTLKRQAFQESSFNPNATSEKNAMGLGQLKADAISDYKKKTGDTDVDPYNPEDSKKMQMWYMKDLYNAEFIDKPNQSEKVRVAKTLASYNWGRGNMLEYLTEAKAKGQDIYNSMEWVEGLPKEAREYVQKILLDDGLNKFYLDMMKGEKNYPETAKLYKKGGLLYNSQNK